MKAKNYIKLPTLQSLKVVNYPLFNYGGEADYWLFEVQDGINMMLGANSIGKTTTVNMIKFAFIGSSGEIDTNYFTERLKKPQRRGKQLIILQFLLNEKSVEIHRNLLTGNLEKFIISNQETTISKYEQFIEENCKMKLDKFSKLLEFVLIRVEEGNYILWDKSVQTEIMSILLNDIEFQEDFFTNEAEYKGIEENLKQIKNLLTNQENRKKELEDTIKNTKNNQSKKVNIDDIEKELTELRQLCLSISQEIKKEQDILNAKNAEASRLYANFEEKKKIVNLYENKIRTIELEIQLLESQLSDLKIPANCILCSTNIPKPKAEQIYKLYFLDKICPVCDSSLGKSIEQKDTNLLKKGLMRCKAELENLKLQLKDAKKGYDDAAQKRKDNEKELENLRKSLTNKEEKLYNLNIKILHLQKTLDLLKQKNPKQPTDYDILLLKVIDDIDELKKKFQDKEKDRQKLALKLSEQRKKRNKIITDFYERLNRIFKNYSKEYFVSSCELVFYPTSNSGLTQLKNFAPKLDDVERLTIKSVSHSQYVFLEYLFRVSLLELYFEETQTKPFLFLETSEGVFDTANTEAAAQLFAKFAVDKFPVILVCNLSKQEFMQKLFGRDDYYNDRRCFNLIRYGNLTPRQQQNKQLKFYFEEKN